MPKFKVTDSTPFFFDTENGYLDNFVMCSDMASLDMRKTPLGYGAKENTLEYLEKHPTFKLLPFKKAFELYEAFNAKKYEVGTIKETTEENFFEKLNCLPPEDWTHNTSTSESFRMCEDMTGNLSSYYIRVSDGWPIKERYFSTIADRFKTDHNKLVQMIREQFKVEAIA